MMSDVLFMQYTFAKIWQCESETVEPRLLIELLQVSESTVYIWKIVIRSIEANRASSRWIGKE